jgi:hypothetical protein
MNTPGKKQDLALIMCPGWGVVQPPVGISYLEGFLKKQGVGVRSYDFSVELFKIFPEKKYWELNHPDFFITPRSFDEHIRPHIGPFLDACADRILRDDPRVAGFSLFMSSMNVSLLLAEKLKKARPGILIVGGGPEVTRVKRVEVDRIDCFAAMNRDIVTGGNFDLLVDGEGEEALLEIIRLLDTYPEKIYEIDGALRVANGTVTANKPRALMKDLDALPGPDYSDFNLGGYVKNSIPLVTSRGCVNRCTFCADSPLWKTYRRRSAEKVVEDIGIIIDRYGKREFEITDSLFNGDIGRVDRICDLILRAGFDIRWSAKAAFHEGMTLPLLQKMKRAGCTSLAYGVESGSPAVLRDMRKNTDLREAKAVIRDTHKAGILANCFFLIGYPTETEQDFRMTLDFIADNAGYIHRFDQVTGCHIEEDSYLGLNLGAYGITFKEDGWHSAVSTPEIRADRLARFKEFAIKLHKHYRCEVQQ